MIENRDGVWSCNVCGKITKTKSHLQSHIESLHTQGHSHVCNICEKIFKARCNLQVHISKILAT